MLHFNGRIYLCVLSFGFHGGHSKWTADITTVSFHILCLCPFHPVSLSIPVLNMLLNELLCVSKVPPGVKHVDLDLSTLPPTTAMAVLIYNRWWVPHNRCLKTTHLFLCTFSICT